MITDIRPLKEALEAAVPRLVAVRERGQTFVVSIPVAYPSGALAAAHISLSGDQCFVSDCALGLREAEMSGASDFFDAAAKDAASLFGVGYDGASLFVASAPISRIEGAIVAVANASASAVGRAVLRAAEAKDRKSNSVLFDLVSDFFGKANVSRKAEIAGRDATWEAHNVVTLDGQQAVFEFVSDHQNSIASKFQMFSDIVKLDERPSLTSVVLSTEKMSKKAHMLIDVSHVISMDAGKETFSRYARIAA
ncbi:hypothetical protein [Xanthobacter sp. VNH20]|uniref:hypothetical protein n=1 Tax=Xanthobacter sp. VNH20 TaxID=3156616 RepID=UPI0032B3FDE2